jgi:pyruvate/2-oxoglutarate dehydrogenase complex dihydrolipoamide acyltransferase (E2) component
MAYIFSFPDVGEGIHEGRIVEWLVAEGATVAEDEALVKVETDKAVVELPSPRAGIVVKLHAAADATIEVGDPLVTIGEAGETAAAGGVAAPVDAPAPAAKARRRSKVEAAAPPAAGRRPAATPRTRALARRLGVDLAVVEGSGPGGRITDEDVELAAAGEHRQAAAAAPAPSTGPAGRREATEAGDVERVPISHLRKVIAGAMHRSKQTAAHVTHVDEADVTELVDHYRRVKPVVEQAGVKFSLMPFFIKALVTALKRHPIFNASVDEEAQEIVLKRYYNIGVAVDTAEGLIVPVVANADAKDMVTLATEVADLAERARTRRLSLDELKGGTCTITNIGPLGGVFATPIINQPELAIVGLHKITERPMVVRGEIAIRKVMYLSVSFDHRYIDGANGARFMTDLVGLVSDPALLMVRL